MTAATFKRKFKLKRIPILIPSSHKRWSYMFFFRFKRTLYTFNNYGPPGHIEKAKEAPIDVINKLYKFKT